MSDSPTPPEKQPVDSVLDRSHCLAGEILDFLRKEQLIVAIDRGVWLLKGTAQSQLGGLLLHKFTNKPS